MSTYRTLGLMSGTSLDGLDIASCIFIKDDGNPWHWELKECDTFQYPRELMVQLSQAKSLSGLDLQLLNVELGKWMGDKANEFIETHMLSIDFVASHGHTVFHEPDHQLTLQIGDPNFIHTITGCPVVSDFRTLDVARGGQGAPLVPVGDELLFSDYEVCINLGGIANLSYRDDQKSRLAFDICACNILLNTLAKLRGFEYDDKGKLAKSGKVVQPLLDRWNDFSFLSKKPPKSLGIELIEPEILSEINTGSYLVEDMLATAVEHIASSIANAIRDAKGAGQVLLTGGGALNNFLIDSLKSKLSKEYKMVTPDSKVINFKEALIFAFLGVLNVRNEYNTLSSVTGATCNSASGQKLGNI